MKPIFNHKLELIGFQGKQRYLFGNLYGPSGLVYRLKNGSPEE